LQQFEFPVGYHEFHKVKIINFQLNRWYSLGYTSLEDIIAVAKRIKVMEDWKPEMIGLAETALSEDRLMNAAFYYRAAEFFTMPSDPDKENLYDRFIDLFYNEVFAEEPIERFSVSYGNSFLPAIRIPPGKEEVKGTIVIHGGFDSFIEEFYSMATYFSDMGYEVVMFEGPGQGAALKKSGLTLDYRWEKPAQAILDYFKLDDVTWMGISMGGWLCFRAAAFEQRIKRVIASSVAFDYMQIPNFFIQAIARFFLLFPRLLNYVSELQMKGDYQERWGVNNLMYITKKDTPYDASEVLLKFNEKNLKSELVKQDVLILTGAEDDLIPLKLHYKQVKALKNANSITEHIFTSQEQAQNHCQIGNIGLALDTMSQWISLKSQGSS
jgi:pimeloyl-ACP methyl ester carboxylesterase